MYSLPILAVDGGGGRLLAHGACGALLFSRAWAGEEGSGILSRWVIKAVKASAVAIAQRCARARRGRDGQRGGGKKRGEEFRLWLTRREKGWGDGGLRCWLLKRPTKPTMELREEMQPRKVDRTGRRCTTQACRCALPADAVRHLHQA